MRRLALLFFLCACPGPSTPDAGIDAGLDAGTLDAGHDAGAPDAGFDAGVPDAGAPDAGLPLAGLCGPTLFAQSYSGSLPDASFPLELGRAVAVNALGGAAFTGTYRGPIDFGGGPLPDPHQNSGMFVTQLFPDAGHAWSRGFADPSGGVILAPHADGLALAHDRASLLVAGAFAGTIDFGSGPLASADPSGPSGGCLSECATDIIILKLAAADGTTQWARRFGNIDADSANAIAVDAFGNVFVAGSASGSVDFGDSADASYGGRDIFVLALDADGGFLWQQRFGGTADDEANALALDDAGIAIAGRYQETVDFGSGIVLSSPGIQDAFAVRLGQWGAALQPATRGTATSLALDSTGAAWVAGTFRGATDGGLGSMFSLFDDGFVTKLSPSGAFLYSRRFGGTLNDTATALAIGASDHPFITGSVAVDTVNFGGGPLTGGAGDDLFVLELDSSGAHQCSRRYPSMDGASNGRGIAVGGAGNTYVTGSFYGTFTPGTVPLTSSNGTSIFLTVFENR